MSFRTQTSALSVVLMLSVTFVAAGGFLSFLEFHEDSTNLNYRKAVLSTSDGKFIISSGLSGNISTHSRAPSGALTFVEHFDVQGGSDAVLSPDDRHLYLVTGYGNSVIAYTRDTVTGGLTFIADYQDGVAGIDGLQLAVSIAISPDGATIYASGANDNGIAAFSRNPTTGALTFIESHFDDAGGVTGIGNPRDLIVSPDGNHVYVAGANDSSIAVFSRSAVTGELTWVGIVTQGEGGVLGLSSVQEVVVSPDGNHVYAGGNAVACFERDSSTGLLTYIEDHSLSFSRGLAINHTGTHLFVTSETQDSLSIFQRDSSTGALTLSDTATHGEDGVNGIDGPTSLALDPRGSAVYVGCEPNTLAVFQVGLFRDDFESSSTSTWSQTVGGAPN